MSKLKGERNLDRGAERHIDVSILSSIHFHTNDKKTLGSSKDRKQEKEGERERGVLLFTQCSASKHIILYTYSVVL